MKLPKVRARLLALVLFFTEIAPGTADPRHISLMPDPHGEFIRLCAPFQTSRYEHPEAVCNCLWGTVFGRIDNMQLIDAILYGIMERGVPNVDATAFPPGQQHKVDQAYSALAEPTLECFFGESTAKRIIEPALSPTSPIFPPVQDLSP
jgi:hypothetical protein